MSDRRQLLDSRPWLRFYPNDIPAALDYPAIGVHALLEETAARHPGRTACTLYDAGLSYAQVLDQSKRLAASLADLGAGRHTRIGMLLPNIPEYVVALNAAWMTGATVLQLSPLFVAEEIHHLVAATGCEIVVTLDLLAGSLLEELGKGPLKHLVVTSLAPRLALWKSWLYRIERRRRHVPFNLPETQQVHWFEHLVSVGSPAFTPRPVAPAKDVALMVPTGGTTGNPKIVQLSHRNLVANGLQLKAWGRGQEAQDRMLGVLPFFHTYGLSVCLLSGTAMAATLHLHPKFEAPAVRDLFVRHRPTLAPAVPAMLAALNRELKKRPADLSDVRAVICGASALNDAVRAEFAGHGARCIAEGYGLSEASPVTHANPLSDAIRPGTIGIPVPDTDARIMDVNAGTTELPIGEVGELAVRGPQVMLGYFENTAETNRALRDGWLYTGDLARRDADGYFTLVDRKRDIIKTNGFLVYPAEVEEVLLRHPQVGEAAVVGVPDLEKGEVVKALVVPRNGHIDLDGILNFCAEHLGKHKRPRSIEAVRELPKNFLGKVLRRHLREAPAKT